MAEDKPHGEESPLEEWRNRALRWQGELIAARNEIEKLNEVNFALSAGQCIVPGGLVSDEYGGQVCTLKAGEDRAMEALGFAFAYLHTVESQGMKVADLSIIKLIDAWKQSTAAVRR